MKKLPKLAVIEPDSDAREVLAEIRTAYHEELEHANVELVWILEERKSKGKTVLGTCRVAPELWFRLAGVDLVVELYRAWWLAADDDAKRYLMDHELSHAAPKLDAGGLQEADATGRRLWRSIPHDVEDFAGPVARWGPQQDLERFLEVAQLSLPGTNGRRGLRAVG